MARAAQTKQLHNFVGGINTEASPLVFPENTAKDLNNIELLRDGSIRRRRGLDLETGGAYSTTTFTNAALADFAISTHEWSSVEGDDSQNFLVLQVGGVLYFHNLGEDILSLSVIGSIDLNAINTSPLYTEVAIDSASAKGKLFIVSRYISPAYIQYNSDAATFSGVKITVKVRDVDGIEEDIDAPIIFGDDVIIPIEETTDPDDDVDDTTIPVPLDELEDFDGFTEITSPTPGY